MTEQESDPELVRRTANVSFLLFALGGVIGLIRMGTTTVPFGKGFEMCMLAQNIARTGLYANPFSTLDTGATAANPPLYPLLLAILYKVFKSQDFVSLFATLGVVFANAITAAWLPRISRLFYGDPRPGVVAAILWLLSVPLLPGWDASFTVTTLLAFVLLAASGINRPNPASYGLGAGLLAAMLFLFNPSTLLIFLPWLVYIAFFHWSYFGWSASKQAAGFCLVVGAVLAMAAFGWMIRNHRELGGFVVRTNLGMTLNSSNNECAQPSLLAAEKTNCYQTHHPNTSIQEAELVRSMGEVEYDRMRVRDTKAWIQAHPAVFARLSLARVRDFWFPELGGHPFESLAIWIGTLLSIPGLALMALRREKVTVFVSVVLLIYPLLYYIVVSDLRYRIPVLWLSLLPAGYFLSFTFDRIRRDAPKDSRLLRQTACGNGVGERIRN